MMPVVASPLAPHELPFAHALTGMTDPTPPSYWLWTTSHCSDCWRASSSRKWASESSKRQTPSRVIVAGRRTDVDLLFTDVHMPGRSTACRWLESRRALAGVHVLMTSGRERPAPAAIPASGKFMPKPYSPDELLRHVKALIRMRDS